MVRLAIALCACVLTSCGLQVRSADLFLLTRAGPGATLTVLVSDGGTIRCNGGAPKPLADQLLINARQLASDLDADAKRGLRIPRSSGSVYAYTVRLQYGTISFPDSAALRRHELAGAEQFALAAAQGPCRR